MRDPLKGLDKKEVELPDTVFVRDIETKVFQSIVAQCLSKIEGVSLLEGGFIDNLLGRDVNDGVKGIHVDQDPKEQTIEIKMEITVSYGISIPKKAEEIQERVTEEVSRLTGLHVGLVHVVFKNLTPGKSLPTIPTDSELVTASP